MIVISIHPVLGVVLVGIILVAMIMILLSVEKMFRRDNATDEAVVQLRKDVKDSPHVVSRSSLFSEFFLMEYRERRRQKGIKKKTSSLKKKPSV